MKIAIYSRSYTEDLRPFITRLLQLSQASEASLCFHRTFLNEIIQAGLTNENHPTYGNGTPMPTDIDLVISIGGDGTMLDTTKFVRGSNVPILGVNAGRLGFLSSIAPDQFDVAWEAIQQKNYDIDYRTTIKLEGAPSDEVHTNFALNEITLQKMDSAAMITIHAYVNGEYLNSYWADGLIVATPSGSTAYSLSCGGPIVLPKSNNFVITPIAPHNLNVRPIVVPDDSTIDLQIESRNDSFLVAMDSRSYALSGSPSLTVKKNDFEIQLLRLENHSYLQTIQTKLNWGWDKRN